MKKLMNIFVYALRITTVCRTRIWGFMIVNLGIVFLFMVSCHKEEARVPVVSTQTISQITDSSALAGGYVISDGGSPVTSHGFVWGSEQEPDIISNSGYISDSKDTGVFSGNLTNLSPGTIYYVKAFGTNNSGIGYGTALSFKTLGKAPSAITQAASDISQSRATLNGIVNPNSLLTIICFEYGTDTGYGKVADAIPGPLDDSTNHNVSATITGLNAGTTYHFRIRSVNDLGITFGNELSFTTLSEQIPSVTTLSATNLQFDGMGSVTLNGSVIPNNLSTTVSFDFGTSENYGQNIPAVPGLLISDTTTPVSANLFQLICNTRYYFRVKAINELGTTFGDEKTFTLWMNTPGPQVIDIDGNTYNSVRIGSQIWMTENLKTTRYNDGTGIPLISDSASWADLITPGYCWYNNDEVVYKNPYGALYNFFAVNTAKLCPVGWHVPTDTEWSVLTTYLGGGSIAGGKLKEAGNLHWRVFVGKPILANNESGFTALPGDYRKFDGTFGSFGVGISGLWWSSTETSSTDAYFRVMGSSDRYVIRTSRTKRDGLSVRCVRD